MAPSEESERTFDLDSILKRLQKSRSPEGGYNGFEFDEALSILASAVPRPSRIATVDWENILRKTLLDAADKGVLDRASFDGTLRNAEAWHWKKDERTFVLATTLSTRYGGHLRRLRFGTSTLTFSRQFPKRFDRSPLDGIPGWPPAPDPPEFVRVRVAVQARSVHQALETALDALNLVRGIWNFSMTRLTFPVWGWGGVPKPINEVQIGPTQTVHFPNGKLAAEVYFYDPEYIPRELPYTGQKWDEILKEFETIRRRLRRIDYQEKIRGAFVRYARALDGIHFESVFLQLWSLLELLTNTRPGDRYDVTIRRALFIFSDRDDHRSVLAHLCKYRNDWVHSGVSSMRAQDNTFQLKRYVDELLRFHFQWSGKFRSLQEVGTFLDFSWDISSLDRRRLLERWAIEFRGKGKKGP